jgi:hypothetical protein
MKRSLVARRAASLAGAAAVLSLVSLVGCIKASDDVTVTEDGSGTFSEVVTLDLSKLKGMEDMFKGMGDPAMGDKPTTPEKKEDPLEKLKKEWEKIPGLELVKSSAEEKDGKYTMTIDAKFKTLEAYALGSQIEYSASLKKNDDGSYTLRFFDADEKPAAEAGMGDAAMGEDPGAAMAAAMMPMLEPFLKDIEMNRKLELPGKVLETNGKKGDDGSSVSWKVTFDDVKAGKTPEQTVTFKGDGLDLKPFSVKREHKHDEPGKK